MAIGTGIGVLGFVAFFGGVVYWTRFTAAGIPADEAVAWVPRANLISTGAAFLVPALITAVVTTLLLAIVYHLFIAAGVTARVDTAAKDKRSAARALTQASADHEKAKAPLEARKARLKNREREFEEAEETPGLEADVEEAKKDRATAKASYEAARGEEVAARAALVAARDASEKAEEKPAKARELQRSERVKRDLSAAGVLVVGELAIAWNGLGALDPFDAFVVFLAALLTVVASLTALQATQSFAAFAVAAFVAVGAFVGVNTYERTKAETKLSPVALLHEGVPAYGFYVTETSDRVLLAFPQRKPTPTRLELSTAGNRTQWFPRDKVTDIEIGPPLDDTTAYLRSLELAVELCNRPAPVAPATPAAAPQERTDAKKKAEAKRKAKAKKTKCDAATITRIRNELGIAVAAARGGP